MMPDEVTRRFDVPGPPIGKPRMTRRDVWKSRPAVMKYREWADKFRAAFEEAGGWPVDEDGTRLKIRQLNWAAWFECPKSYSKKKKEYLSGKLHTEKPDRDNIDKAVLDALFRNIPEDDKEVAYGLIQKHWCKDGKALLYVEMRFYDTVI